MLAVTGSEHGISYLQLIYGVVDVMLVYRTGMLAVTGSEHDISFIYALFSFFLYLVSSFRVNLVKALRTLEERAI